MLLGIAMIACLLGWYVQEMKLRQCETDYSRYSKMQKFEIIGTGGWWYQYRREIPRSLSSSLVSIFLPEIDDTSKSNPITQDYELHFATYQRHKYEVKQPEKSKVVCLIHPGHHELELVVHDSDSGMATIQVCVDSVAQFPKPKLIDFPHKSWDFSDGSTNTKKQIQRERCWIVRQKEFDFESGYYTYFVVWIQDPTYSWTDIVIAEELTKAVGAAGRVKR